MARRLVDLSVPLVAGIASDPPGYRPEITYRGHRETTSEVCRFFPGLRPEDLPDGEGWAIEQVAMTTHAGTHLDAPWHYASTQDRALVPGGRPALTIDQVPLEWCFAAGVKLDFRDRPDGHVVSAAEVEAELARIGHALRPLDIVLVNTRAGSRYGQEDYVEAGCGMGREATLWLLERGVRVTGTDAWSWDAPFAHTRRRFLERPDPAIVWEGHKAGRERGWCHLEKLANLELLPATGFEVCCFPVKVAGGSAGWCRAVAILEED